MSTYAVPCLFCNGPSCCRLPLYLVVLENTSNEPRYLGTITIPLLRIGSAMREEMQVTRLRKPFVNGEKGEFNVYDLMGLSIGSASVSYRIYCLGNLALPHIPPTTSVKTEKQEVLESGSKLGDEKTTSEKGIETKVETRTGSALQEKISVSVPCQTDRQSVKVERIVLDEQPRLVLTESNVQAEDDGKSQNESLSRKNPPDLFYCRTRPLANQQTIQDASIAIDDLEKKLNETDASDHEVTQNEFTSLNKNFDSFPILEALMKEIELIKLQKPRDRLGMKNGCEEKVTQTSPTKVKKDHEKTTTMSRYSHDTHANTGLSVMTDRPRSGMLHQSGVGSKHSHRRLCELRISDRVPAQTSWIRTSNVPTPGRRSKSKLEYGLTSSYLARLRNSNPSLFESLPLSNAYLDKSLDHDGRASSRADRHSKDRTESRFCKKSQKSHGSCKHKSSHVAASSDVKQRKKNATITKSHKSAKAKDVEDGNVPKSSDVLSGQERTVIQVEVPSQNVDLMDDSFEKLISSPVYMNQSFDQTVDVKLEDIDERLGRIDSEEQNVGDETKSPLLREEDRTETTMDKIEANFAQVTNGVFNRRELETSSRQSQSSDDEREGMNGANVSPASKSLDDMSKHDSGGETINVKKVMPPVQRSYSDDFDQESDAGFSPPPSRHVDNKVEQILLSSAVSAGNDDKEELKDDQSLGSSGSYSSPSRTGYRPTFGRR